MSKLLQIVAITILSATVLMASPARKPPLRPQAPALVPEPASLVLMGSGLAALASRFRKKR